MKSYLRALAGAALFLAMPGVVQAECSVVNNRPWCVGKIEVLFLHESGNLYIATDGDETKLGCQLKEPSMIDIPASHPLFSSFLSMLLAAQLSGKTIAFRMNGTVGEPCSVSYLKLLTNPPPP